MWEQIIKHLLTNSLLLFTKNAPLEERPFVIVTASYNNVQWCEKNLESIFSQNYDNWHLIYINDCSTDGTGELVQQFIDTHHMQDKVTLINNDTRQGHLANQYNAIHSCIDNEIVAIVDGDDWLAHPNVLKHLNGIYANKNVWLTFGQFKYYPSGKSGFCKPIPETCVANNLFRKYSVALSHLRTFYAGLFKQIKLEDLKYNDQFFPMAADVATMFPMIEMAGERFRFIPETLLIYNTANQLNIAKDRAHLQKMYCAMIFAKEPYKRLATMSFTA